MGTKSEEKISIELEMNESWPSVPISSIANAVIGGTPSRGEPQYWGGTTPWATAKDVASVSGRYLHQVEECITEKGLKSSAAKLMPEGTVVITARGTVGALAQLGQEMAFNQTCYAIAPNDNLDNNFLFYALKGTLAEMRTLTYGSVFETITKRSFDNWRIPCPQLPVQRSIAHILGTLDDRIELNRQINQTLEEMAHAIYKDWFVDFGPVRAKIEGLEPYLPPNLWELFPDHLVDSEFGNIPEKWEVKALSDCFNLTMGQSPPGTSYNDNGLGLPFFQGSTNFGFRFPEYSRYCTKPTREAKADDTLVSVRAPVGALNMAWERCCIGRGVAALRHKSGSSSFTYLSARNMQPDLQLYEQTGTVFGAITRKQFEALKILEPTNELIRAFDKLIVPLDCQIRNNMAGTHNLSLQRDAMLPKLVSGEIRVGVQY